MCEILGMSMNLGDSILLTASMMRRVSLFSDCHPSHHLQFLSAAAARQVKM